MSDAKWELIAPFCPLCEGTSPAHLALTYFLNGMFDVLRFGCNWRDMCER
ncbi:transposase [Novosphingobium sp. ERN07]|nr:transposase [Novosphingobium sp. ERN07]